MTSRPPCGRARSSHQFAIRSRAIDKATNQEQGGTGTTPFNFVVDSTAPISSIGSLANNAVISTITLVSGTATDINAYGHTRMQNVYVTLYRKSNGWVYKPGHALDANPGTPGWFSPSLSLNDPEYFNTASYTDYAGAGISSGTWSWPVPNLTIFNGKEFGVIAHAKDQAGNYEVAWTTVSFYLNQYQVSPQSPDSTISSPADDSHTKTALTTISGDATDLVNLTAVRVKLMRLVGSTTWYLNDSNTWQNTDPGLYPLASSVSGIESAWTFRYHLQDEYRECDLFRHLYCHGPGRQRSAGALDEHLRL